MRAVAAIAIGACVAGVIGACGGRRAIEVEGGSAPQAPDSVYVRVINDHYNDVRVHALYEGGSRYAMGFVVGKSPGPLTAIVWRPRALVFEISFVGPEEVYLSDELVPAPGDVIQLTIPPNIASSVNFRRR